jgi:hypothetical protein
LAAAYGLLASPGFAEDAESISEPAAVTEGIPEGYESYHVRPDILSVTPQAHPELGKAWKDFKRAQLEAAAMLLEMYPNQDLYFLARDGELLHDLVRWEAKDDPQLSKRIHLLNVSRSSRFGKHIKDYLAQEGISEQSLKSGKKVLLIDTGFQGQISKTIERMFQDELHGNFKTQMMLSGNPKMPSCRSFLVALNPFALTYHPVFLQRIVEQVYERLPKITHRSIDYARAQGKWQPISPTHQESRTPVDKSKALALMEDLIHDAQSDEFRELMKTRREQWRYLRELAQTGDSAKITEGLGLFLAGRPDDIFAEAMVHDFVDMADLNHLPTNKHVTLSLEEIDQAKARHLKIARSQVHNVSSCPDVVEKLRDLLKIDQ